MKSKTFKVMARIILEVEKGTTKCNYCPFGVADCYGHYSCIMGVAEEFPCEEYDLTTMKLVEVEED
jgi:hypothetical protein